MIQNYNIDITEFVKITNAGIFAADYTQIRAALIRRYKDIYGSDIDLSTGSADGTWIAQQALIINNMCQVIKNLYGNLNVDTASGIYLDALCALSNVKRRQATKSTANVKITNLLDSENNFANLSFLDKSGLEWTYSKPISLAANESKAITIECSQYGQISAPKGWIYQTIEVTNLNVEQLEDASIGLNQETDSELRARRNESFSINGVTVLESLVAALLNISGIEDVKVYNNNSSSAITSKDGTSIADHTIYVIVRKKEGVNVIDENVGTTIYLKLTPGIRTSQPDASLPADCKKQYEYIPYINDRQIVGFYQFVYWKQAVALNPSIVIKIAPLSYFSINEIPEIASAAISYLNSLKLSDDIDPVSLQTEIIYADPLFKGRSTYSFTSITGPSNYTVNNDNYFYFTKYFVKSNGTITNGMNEYSIVNGSVTINGVNYTLYNNCISDGTNTYVITNNRFVISNETYVISIESISKDTNDYTITLS